MSAPILASLTWKMRQGSKRLLASTTMPASSASRVAAEILHSFAGKNFTPRDVEVGEGEVKKFSYRSDDLTPSLRRIRGGE